MKRVISYAWFWDKTSNRPKGSFSRFAPAVFRAARCIYPDFEIRVHHDDNLDAEEYGPAMRRLHDAGALTLVDCGVSQGLSRSSLWRLKPVFEPDVGLVLCRDLDSIVTVRERWAVEHFWFTGLAIHAINDCPSHVSPSWPEGAIMTGTCAFSPRELLKYTEVKSLDAIYQRAAEMGMGLDAYGQDERVLNDVFQKHQDEILGHVPRGGEQHADIYDFVPNDDGDLQRSHPAAFLGATLDHEIAAHPSAFTEYIGMVLTEPERAREFYSHREHTRIFDEVGA